MTPAKAQRRKVTGRGPSSRGDARDLREISPFGRNDMFVIPLCAFTPLREIILFPVAAVPGDVDDRSGAVIGFGSTLLEVLHG